MSINKFNKLKILGIKLGINEKPYKDKTYLHPFEAVLYNGRLYLTFRNKIENKDICISANIEKKAEENILKDRKITIHYVNGVISGVHIVNIAPTNIPGYNIMMRLMLFKNGVLQGIFGRSHIYTVDVKRMGVCAQVSMYTKTQLQDEETIGSEEYLVNDCLEIYEVKEQLTEEEMNSEEWDMTTYDVDYGVRRIEYIRRTNKLNKNLVTIEEMGV